MEFGGASDGVLVSLQRATSLCDRGVEIVDGCEMSIDERLVDEGPKVLCRLQLRAVGGLEDQPDAVGNGEVFRTVPAGLVEYDNDDALAAGTGLPCEGFEQFGKERLVDAVRQIPDGFSAHRRNEGGDIEPFVVPRPVAGSVSGRSDAHPSPRARSACRDAGWLLRQPRPPGFFKKLRLFGGGGVWVVRARRLDRPIDRSQRLPAALRRKLLEPKLTGHPVRDLAARP